MSTSEKRTVIQLPAFPVSNPSRISTTRSGTTSRVLWIAAYVAVMVVVSFRLPGISDNLTRQVPADVRSELGDDRLLGLSMMVGTVLFFVAYAIIMGLFLSLASLLDRRLVPGKVDLGRRLKIGLFYVVAVLATLPVQLVGLLFSSQQPRDIPGYWLYFPLMSFSVLLLFRRQWRGLTVSRQVLIAVATIALASVVSFG